MSDGPDTIVVGCLPRTPGEDAPVPSEVRNCVSCGKEVWISDHLVRQAGTDHPGVPVKCYCTFTCLPGAVEEHHVTITDAQRAMLREDHDLTDDEMDEMLAFMNIAMQEGRTAHLDAWGPPTTERKDQP